MLREATATTTHREPQTSKLTLSLENLEVSTFEPAAREAKPAQALYVTLDTALYCTQAKYTCIYACFPQ